MQSRCNQSRPRHKTKVAVSIISEVYSSSYVIFIKLRFHSHGVVKETTDTHLVSIITCYFLTFHQSLYWLPSPRFLCKIPRDPQPFSLLASPINVFSHKKWKLLSDKYKLWHRYNVGFWSFNTSYVDAVPTFRLTFQLPSSGWIWDERIEQYIISTVQVRVRNVIRAAIYWDFSLWLGRGIGGFACSVGIHLCGKVVRVFANFSGFSDVTDRVKVVVCYGFCFMLVHSMFVPVGLSSTADRWFTFLASLMNTDSVAEVWCQRSLLSPFQSNRDPISTLWRLAFMCIILVVKDPVLILEITRSKTSIWQNG